MADHGAGLLLGEGGDREVRRAVHSRGLATSFGFRRRPTSAIPVIGDNGQTDAPPTDRRRPPSANAPLDTNGNSRQSQRLQPPKKELAATRLNRFGFRHQSQPSTRTRCETAPECRNNNMEKTRSKGAGPGIGTDVSKAVPFAVPATNNNNKADFNRNNNNNNRRWPTSISQPAAAKLTLHSSQLPRPQPPAMRVTVVESKSAKTVANLNRKVAAAAAAAAAAEECLPSSKEGSVTEEDSGIGSAHHRPYCCDADPLHGSSTFGVRRSSDDVDGVVTEVAVIPLPRLPSVFDSEPASRRRRRRRKLSATSSEGFSDDDDDDDEEKSVRDRSSTEKVRTALHVDEPPPDWAQGGEAMVEEYSLNLSSSDEGKDPVVAAGSLCGTIPKGRSADGIVRSVLLTIEDPKFAAVASAAGNLLDDETSPIDSLISSCTESDDLASTCHKRRPPSASASPSSPTSPGTPTNTSLSLSEGRDFLIDDEIADQPALTFNGGRYARSRAVATAAPDSDSAPTATLAAVGTPTPTPPPAGEMRATALAPAPAPALGTPLRRVNSVDTLSPCESIASDDLMLDFEQSVSSGLDDSAADRVQPLHSLNPAAIRYELEHQDLHVAQQWSALLGTAANTSVCRGGMARPRTTTPGSSLPESPRGGAVLTTAACRPHSPLLVRATRGSTVASANVAAAAYDSDDSVRVDRPTVNDLVAIKTMLIKLKRVLQEAGPLPLDPLRNGYCCDGVACVPDGTGPDLADLRRQIEFLQSQLEDKERTVRQLQTQVTRYSAADKGHGHDRLDTCNAATQTERMRPVSAGPALLHHLPADGGGGGGGPLVSVNDSGRRPPRPSSMVEAPSPTRPPPLKLWRKPGEPAPPPSRYMIMMMAPNASLPRRARSRSRVLPPSSSSST